MRGRPSAPIVIDVWCPTLPVVSRAMMVAAVQMAVVQRAIFKSLLLPSW